MRQLEPIFRSLPPILFVFGIVLAIANVAELRATTSSAGMEASFMTEMRVTFLVGLARSFYDLFFFWGIAALVAAANRFVGVQLDV